MTSRWVGRFDPNPGFAFSSRRRLARASSPHRSEPTIVAPASSRHALASSHCAHNCSAGFQPACARLIAVRSCCQDGGATTEIHSIALRSQLRRRRLAGMSSPPRSAPRPSRSAEKVARGFIPRVDVTLGGALRPGPGIRLFFAPASRSCELDSAHCAHNCSAGFQPACARLIAVRSQL